MKNRTQLEIGGENQEIKKEEFNFPEIACLKEGMNALVHKLWANIDAGKYDALISDEVGGRIPTLVLREIIKARIPDANIGTYFIASGKTYVPQPGSDDYEKFAEYIKEIIKDDTN